MTCDELSSRAIDYVDGTLTADHRAELETHAEDCQVCREHLRALRQTWVGLGDWPQEEPGPMLRERFYTMLDAVPMVAAERPAVHRFAAWCAGLKDRRPFGLASAAALLFVVGILIGTGMSRGSSPPDLDVERLRAEVRSLSQLVTLSLLQQDSATERLKGVRYGSVAAEHDDLVLTALIDAVGHDPSVGVRLAAIEALQPHISRGTVSNSLLASLQSERSPLVQVALVDALTGAGGRATRETFDALASDPTVDDTVRAHVQTRLEEPL